MTQQTTSTGISIREGKDGGSIVIRFRWQDQDRRETLNLKPTKANLNYAGRMKEAITTDIKNGSFKYSSYFPGSSIVKHEELQVLDVLEKNGLCKGITFAELATKWRIVHIAGKSKGYIEICELRVSRLIKIFGDLPVQSIKYSDLAGLLGGQPWASADLYNRHLYDLKRIFKMACTDGVIKSNPALSLERRRVTKKDVDPLSIEEVTVILDYMRQNYHPQIVNYFQFAFYTGLRSGELLGLRWERLDFTQKTAYVCHTRGRCYTKDTTKTGVNRHVDLNHKAVEALESQKPYTQHHDGYVFYNPRMRKPLEKSGLTLREQYWHPALDALGIKRRRMYETRHAYATMLLMSGCKPGYAADQLGHSVEMFFNVYSRWINQTEANQERQKVSEFLS